MVLWDIIRDFFVQYIFGGISSNGDTFSGIVASEYVNEPGIGNIPGYEGYRPIYGEDFHFYIGNFQISICDWLSTTFTIISLVIFVLCIFFFIRYMFRLTAGLVRGH